MQLGPFYTGQIPREPLTLLVKDLGSDEPVDLTGYTGVAFALQDPDGNSVDTSGGIATIAHAEGGQVTFQFPTGTSLFDQDGDYDLQVRLIGTGVLDLTVPVTFEVHRALGS